MTLLRNAYLVALNETIVACREAGQYHAQAAESAPLEDLGRALRELSQDREKAADELAEFVIAEEDIPNTSSDEKVLLQAAATRLKLAVGAATQQLLEDCGAKEESLVEAADELLEQDIGDDLRRLVSALREDAGSRVDWLKKKLIAS